MYTLPSQSGGVINSVLVELIVISREQRNSRIVTSSAGTIFCSLSLCWACDFALTSNRWYVDIAEKFYVVELAALCGHNPLCQQDSSLPAFYFLRNLCIVSFLSSKALHMLCPIFKHSSLLSWRFNCVFTIPMAFSDNFAFSRCV